MRTIQLLRLSVLVVVCSSAAWAEEGQVFPPADQNIPVGEAVAGGNVVVVAQRKNELFLLTRDISGAFALVSVPKGEPPERAVVLLPPVSGKVITSVLPAADAIYVLAKEGGRAQLSRIPVRSVGGTEIGFSQKFVSACRNCRAFPALRRNRVQRISLPEGGSLSGISSDPTRPGVRIAWTDSSSRTSTLAYDPSRERFSAPKM